MKKREFEELKSRNASVLKDVIAIETSSENPTDKAEIAAEKKFGEYISETDKFASKGSKSYIASNTVSKQQVEDAKKDVEEEIKRAYDIFNGLNDIARENHFVVLDDEDNLVLENERKVYELYDKLKNGLLTAEEFSDLVDYTRQMSFNESLRNYVDMGRTVVMDRIQKLEKESNKKVFLIFEPVMTKFKEKLGVLETKSLDSFEKPRENVTDTDNKTRLEAKEIEAELEAIFASFFDGNLDEIINENYTAADIEKMLKETEKLKMNYEKTNVAPNDDGLYSVDAVLKRDNAWVEYINSLNKTIKVLQIGHLKQCYSDIQKYKVADTSSGNMICLQVGDEFLSISKDMNKFVDDMALFYKKVHEFENRKEDKEEEKFDIADSFKSIELNEPEMKSEQSNEKDSAEELNEPAVIDPLEAIRNMKIPLEKKEEDEALVEPEREEVSNTSSLEETKEIEIPINDSLEKTKEDPLEAIKNMEISLEKNEDNKDLLEAVRNIEMSDVKEEVAVEKDPLEAIKNIEISTSETKEEANSPLEEPDNKKSLEKLPTIATLEPVNEPVVSLQDNNETNITSPKQAYIEFMSCFVDRDEANNLATEENINMFETSNLGFNRYISEINTGNISSDMTYESFIVSQIKKDNGIKYGEPVKVVSNKKDDSGLDVILADDVQNISNFEKDLSGLDVFADDPMQFSDDAGQFSPKTR